ncbi:MAG: flagellar basal body P-ring protein FlgI [Pseudomonadota bacterium]
MKRILALSLILLLAFLLIYPTAASQTRIRDLVDVEGVRQNDLLGYGIVVGLNGTGDSVRNAPFTEGTLSLMLQRLGANVQGEQIRPNNVAGVFVTASLPAFARKGSRIDVTVSSNGDAQSLEGGTLLLTELRGLDGQVYAVAQGNLIVSGIDVQAQGARQTQGTPTVGTIAAGARIEREINFDFSQQRSLTLALRNPDFSTAATIEEAINGAMKMPVANMRDPGTIDLNLSPINASPARILATIENLPVAVTGPARIVIDERSGTIVFGEDVTVSRVAIAQGNISIKVSETTVVSQPNPFSDGETVALPRSTITVDQTRDGNIAILQDNTTLSDLITGLNSLGVTPQEMSDIIRSMKAAGAIHAELVIQ